MNKKEKNFRKKYEVPLIARRNFSKLESKDYAKECMEKLKHTPLASPSLLNQSWMDNEKARED